MDGALEKKQHEQQGAGRLVQQTLVGTSPTICAFILTLVWMLFTLGWCHAQAPAALSPTSQSLIRAAHVYDEVGMTAAC